MNFVLDTHSDDLDIDIEIDFDDGLAPTEKVGCLEAAAAEAILVEASKTPSGRTRISFAIPL